MGTNSTGCTEWERDFDPSTEHPYPSKLEWSDFLKSHQEQVANLLAEIDRLRDQQLIRNLQVVDDDKGDSMKADKIMTRKEYFDLPLYHWHSVCWDYDGVGSVGIKYDGRSPPRS